MKYLAALVMAAALGTSPLTSAQTRMTAPPPAMPTPSAQPMTQPPSERAPSERDTAAAETHLAALVPAGMSTQEACAGFKTLRDCATALHAAHNLDIPFVDLKAKVTGGQKLPAAIHELKPDAKAREEVRRAEEQAHSELSGRG